MKKIFTPKFYNSFILCLGSYLTADAQAGEWTWMKGSNSYNAGAVYGTLGVADTNNTPMATYEPAEWKDLQGRFWFFGGLSGGESNELWVYDEQINSWTWEGGSNQYGQPASYGTQGVPAATNWPGARAWGAPTWVDHDGNLWLFGGLGYDANGNWGELNDLWRFNISTMEWTWMSGSTIGGQTGIYGTQGVPDPNNVPRCRHECNTSWVDDNNDLWLFGGYNFSGDLNDLWRFSTGTNEWTWMKGANFAGQPGVYGTLGVPSSSNVPGARMCYCKFRDSQDRFWMFGGYDSQFSIVFNDLWMYNPSTNEWTWMSGTNLSNDQGTYSSICDSTITNFPKSRYENRACWTDPDGKFWLFGGTSDPFGATTLNDLWYYKPSTNEWTWASGSSGQNSSGVYGTQGIASANNFPAAAFGSVGWADNSCNLWLFGGVHTWSYEKSNTLWKYTPGCGACGLQSSINLSATDTSICEKFCISFFDQSSNNPTAWLWLFPGGAPSSSTNQNPANICYDIPGFYDVTLITTNANGNDTVTFANFITVYATPPFPTITQVGYTLTSSPATSYQWQFNSYDIPGATNQSYTVTQTGYYTILVSDNNGCVNSTTEYVLIDGIDEVMNETNILIYPNPSLGNFIVEFLNGAMAGEVSIDVVNTLGQMVFSSSSEKVSDDNSKKEINLSDVSTGVYFIEIKTVSELVRKKIVIAK